MKLLSYPLYFVLVASFTTPRVVNSGVLPLYPVEFFSGGYVKTFNYPPIWNGCLNTILYTVLGTVISIGVTLSSAYALSRRDMFGQRWLMLLFSFTMFFGGGMIPSYLLIRNLGLYDTLWVKMHRLYHIQADKPPRNEGHIVGIGILWHAYTNQPQPVSA